ncbi:O-acetylhomoserine aminocarboxypropyltransferase/cysteine synthase family protein [Wohlfahrtiimonas chitiniclastica]|uniref:O-acetylhomoserine aminocarboxypropyltransferase/cysteine synthase n=1 Tax=Wohlfahrtiimonas chitiniclastica TaxID=400946 RepID=A0AB35BYF9_9GAMM|nr:O-acetylhomoserine aminocarboxypropyltransferase/cysteine synthase family protein [Wohlfahrtiimonas chitiniclastica]MBS7817183.1 O-acetylhomoserine aminocarboxypropyltransferase/cysteine synthase [Wohlfahrtiimonas chitiniclastica]MBS7822962.1 O-acetylhomoserine aminocarboxypropyltransferase/cysteine synthase [Wohlfahrtiimonas chitiniclastica]MBS7824108.1 O-acetylhomoserine aminocarboxypropyltransferase/cysteine synthase [Wohlfahrtiimonas chitiniclastica]MBS7830776.1 O-acetylhomoserine aminoc
MTQKLHLETLAVHQGFRGDETNSIVRPIHTSTAFAFNDADHGADLFNLSAVGNIYSRLTNPTNDALGNVVAELEGGVGGLSVASGAAALLTTVLSICESGDHIVSSKSIYGGSYSLFSNTLKNFGIQVTYVDQNASREEIQQAFQENTKILFAEVIGNPKVEVLNVEKFAALAKANDVPFVVDSTFTPPAIFKAFDHGVNIVVHSATKYLGGHGNALAGVIVDSGTFDWNNGKFPSLTTPQDAYHGLVYTEAFGNLAFLIKARAHVLRDIGASLSPFNAFLVLQGIQTLHLRLDYVSKSALALAQWLENHPQVEWVSYPLLESNPDYDRAKAYFPKGAGGILAFGIKGGREKSRAFINGLELGIHAVNVGDVRTIVTHPASTTHRQTPADELAALGISEGFIRISVGLENVEDIKADLDQALQRG